MRPLILANKDEIATHVQKLKRVADYIYFLYTSQARNQDFMWGGANEARVDQTTEMYFLLSDPFI